MFKKSLHNLKTLTHLRSSDRRKLKQRAIAAFELTSEQGDALVPDGISSVKFSTHLDEPGVAYIDPDGDPLWFTVGKDSDDLIPTIYTLWRKEDLLPFLSTPAAVVPILIGGADLMIPGVIHCPPSLGEDQLVAIRQHVRKDGKSALSPPVAVGRMALPGDQIREVTQGKGKAVHIYHTWKDNLWDMGSKKDIPENSVLPDSSVSTPEPPSSADIDEAKDADKASSSPREDTSGLTPEESIASSTISYSPQEVTELLNKSLLQAISTTLSSLPPSGFPIPATLLYTNHILPSRPAFPFLVLPPTNSLEDPDRLSNKSPQVDTEITIKSSSHKSLTTFLKAAEKASLLTLKAPQKQQPDILVTSVNASHQIVRDHIAFVTVREVDLKAAKKAAREEKQREDLAANIEIKELWKPHLVSINLFEKMGANKSTLYSMTEIRDLLTSYITTHNLVNLREQAYINLDDLLHSCVSTKSTGKAKSKGLDSPEPTMSKFMKRDELIKAVLEKMQNWYQIRVEGKDPVTKKGGLSPIQVAIKIRQGHGSKATTLITGFEPFLVIDAEEMAEYLRKECAGATSVSPVPGRPGLEVLVQGKQSQAVVEYLTSKGIPKKWIEVSEPSRKK